MKAFVHHEPKDIGEVISLLKANAKGPAKKDVASLQERNKVKVIAGGTDLLGLIKDGLMAPEQLIDLKKIPTLSYLQDEAGGLAIGATTILAELAESSRIRQRFPALAQASQAVASPQIRNMGTVAGNLCQRVRCWYYRSPEASDCYKKGGSTCYAVFGNNSIHGIMDCALCFAVHPSDTAVALLALGATVKTAGPQGERRVPLDQFFIGPGVDYTRETILEPDEIVTEVLVPPQGTSGRSLFLKFAPRSSFDFALASVGVALIGSTVVQQARIVLGGVAPTPLRVPQAEALLQGKRITEELAAQAAEAAVAGAKPLNSNAFKIDLAKALVKRALVELA